MNKNLNLFKISLLSPVPEEQQPMAEYINLKKYLEKKDNVTMFLNKILIYIKMGNLFKEYHIQ
jgi:hypothetical protein